MKIETVTEKTSRLTLSNSDITEMVRAYTPGANISLPASLRVTATGGLVIEWKETTVQGDET